MTVRLPHPEIDITVQRANTASQTDGSDGLKLDSRSGPMRQPTSSNNSEAVSTIQKGFKTSLGILEKASSPFAPLQAVAGGLLAIIETVEVSQCQVASSSEGF